MKGTDIEFVVSQEGDFKYLSNLKFKSNGLMIQHLHVHYNGTMEEFKK